MNIGQLRKKVSEMYKYRKENGVTIIGNVPKSPSRFIHNLRKAQCEKMIDNFTIVFSSEISPKKVVWEGKKDAEAPKMEAEIDAKAPKMEAEIDAEIEELPPVKLNKDREYVTSNGLISSSELASDLNIDTINSNINSVNELAKKAYENSKNGSQSISIKVGSAPKVELKNEHLHPLYERILFHLEIDKNVYLYGASGAGKTTIAYQVAKAFNLPDIAVLSCSAGMSESMILGVSIPNVTTGVPVYITTQFLKVWENGGVILLDEFDALDGNVGVMLNSGLADGNIPVPRRQENPIAKRHPNCYVIGAGNTDGSGNGSRQYAGRNKLDGATLNRFTLLKFGYDTKLEKKLSGGHNDVYKSLNKLRKSVNQFELQRVISTRDFLRLGKWRAMGKGLDYCLNAVTESWTQFETDKVNLQGIISEFTRV